MAGYAALSVAKTLSASPFLHSVASVSQREAEALTSLHFPSSAKRSCSSLMVRGMSAPSEMTMLLRSTP